MTADTPTFLPSLAVVDPDPDLSLTSHDNVIEDETPSKTIGPTRSIISMKRASLAWAQNGHSLSFDSVTELVSKQPESSFPKKRSQSAKRSLQSCRVVVNSGLLLATKTHQTNTPMNSPPTHRQSVIKSAGRTLLKTREATTAWGISPTSPNPTTILAANKPVAGPQAFTRQPRRRPISWSEDSPKMDMQSPRLRRGTSLACRRGQSLDGGESPESPDTNYIHSKPSSKSQARLAGKEGGGGDAVTPDSSTSPTSPLNSSSRVWDSFEEHVHASHDPKDMLSRHQSPSSFQASFAFQETMVDLYGYPDYSHPPPTHSFTQMAARSGYVNEAVSRFRELRRRSLAAKSVTYQLTVENARRGWRILRQYVQDHFISKRTSHAALSWTMLRHTVKGMSDMDKTRRDLYRRYGVIPSQDQEGNVTMVNTMLSQRAKGSHKTPTPTPTPTPSHDNRHHHHLYQPTAYPLPHSHGSQGRSLSSSLPAAWMSPRASEGLGGQRCTASTTTKRGARAIPITRPHSSVSAGDRIRSSSSIRSSSGGGSSSTARVTPPVGKISGSVLRPSRSQDS